MTKSNKNTVDRTIKDIPIVCPRCKQARMVTYPQSWNIKKGRCNSYCLSCAAKNGGTHKNLGERSEKGYVIPLETREKIGRLGHPPYFVAFGADNPAWKGGITTKSKLFRKTKPYQNWRKEVFERDGYTCQFCGQIGGSLHADHIKPFAYFKEQRLDINNGRTLCVECHKTTDTYLSGALKWRTT